MTAEIRGMAPLLEVRDLAASLAFYRNALGFEVVLSAGEEPDLGWVLLGRGGVELMLNAASEEGECAADPSPDRLAGHRDVTLFFGCPDPDAAYERLCARGVAADPPGLTGYGFRALTATDPDGYGICLHWPVTPESVEDWRRRYGFDPAAEVPHGG